MAYMDELKEEVKKDGGDIAGAALKEAVNGAQKAQPIACIALPEPIMEKVLIILRKMSYETISNLMEEIKKEAIGVNVTKQ